MTLLEGLRLFLYIIAAIETVLIIIVCFDHSKLAGFYSMIFSIVLYIFLFDNVVCLNGIQCFVAEVLLHYDDNYIRKDEIQELTDIAVKKAIDDYKREQEKQKEKE